MKCRGRHGRKAGFTLAEVLAALLFMAIVIPVAVEGLQVATRAAQMGTRRIAAARVGERILQDLILTGQWRRGFQTGQATEGLWTYVWESRLDPWMEGSLRMLTVQVRFPVLGQESTVTLSTVVDASQ
ncbi:MAG: type II secretion system protein [Verrucomicrobiota bacterium]|nr:type II secretion system GspH family protein [Limisphaera sp.]MDW8381194.1 type II secretion system protein [Verrucomicrobiota bacterium]